MKNIFLMLCISLVLFSCKKKEETHTSGIDTIDNTTHMGSTYYVYGFSFPDARLVSTESHPGPDITIYVNNDNPNIPPRLYFMANNLLPSFYKAGEYTSESAASDAFNSLKSISVPMWTDFADPVKPNQVWIYRSQGEKYAKIRIISTVNERRKDTSALRDSVDYAECTFEWVYQPDGTITFP
jgi:hypothetical protein